MNQKEAVYEAVSQVFPVGEGAVPATGAWTSSQKEHIHDALFLMFKEGQVEYRGGVPADDVLKKYIPGLVNNWVRKDTRLNGGTKYEAKRPGSRTGSGDEVLKNMKALLSVTTDPDARRQVQQAIDERVATLKPKTTTVIDVTKIPENLRHLVK